MKPRELSGELLGVVKVCHLDVPIRRATPTQVPELLGDEGLLDGFVDFEHVTIYIRAGQSPSQERDSIVHELIHAFLMFSGLHHILQAGFGKKKGFDDFEETIVRVATPHLVGLGELLGLD